MANGLPAAMIDSAPVFARRRQQRLPRLEGAASRTSDVLVAFFAWAAAGVILVIFALLLTNLVGAGYKYLSWSFLVDSPTHSGRGGGIFPILVSTALLLAVAMIVVIPFGLATAIVISEVTRATSRFKRWVSLCLDILAGVPSIVFGLFGNAFFSVYLGLGFSILAGGLTLACMILPIFVRAVESGFSAVPDDWRRGAFALGLTRPAVLRHLTIPAAAPAIAVGLVLGIGRALAETAALIFTSGYVDRMPTSLLDSGRSLAIHIYELSMNVPGAEHNAYASTLVLIVLLVAINGAAFWLTECLLHKRVAHS